MNIFSLKSSKIPRFFSFFFFACAIIPDISILKIDIGQLYRTFIVRNAKRFQSISQRFFRFSFSQLYSFLVFAYSFPFKYKFPWSNGIFQYIMMLVFERTNKQTEKKNPNIQKKKMNENNRMELYQTVHVQLA